MRPAALIHHAHPLNLRSLWRQHFGYGRGAWRFHQIRAARGAEPFRPDMAFYLKLLRASCSRASWYESALMPAYLLWAQMANAAGFFYQRLVKEDGARRRPLRLNYPQPVNANGADDIPEGEK